MLAGKSESDSARSGGQLPLRMRVLYVAPTAGESTWLRHALDDDPAVAIELTEAAGAAAGLTRLNEVPFDVALLRHAPPTLDAFTVTEALRAAGSEEPVVVLADGSDPELVAIACEAGVDACCSLANTTTRSLLWNLTRAVERQSLLKERRRLVDAERHRLQHEHQEAERLLTEQRELIAGVRARHAVGDRFESQAFTCNRKKSLSIPAPLVEQYTQLLRTHVIMGSGNLGPELAQLVARLLVANTSAAETMELHLRALEDLVQGLGNRSARHVMSRADLLIVETMMRLCEGYRDRLGDESPVRAAS